MSTACITHTTPTDLLRKCKTVNSCVTWYVSLQDHILLDYTLIEVNERPLKEIVVTSKQDGESFSLFDCKFNLDDPATPSGTGEMETVSILHYPLGQPLKRSTQGGINVGELSGYGCQGFLAPLKYSRSHMKCYYHNKYFNCYT